MKATLLQRNTQSSFLINSPQTKDGYRALVWNAGPAIQLDRCSLLSHVPPIPKHSAHTDVHALVQLEGTRKISGVPTAPSSRGPSTLSGVFTVGLPRGMSKRDNVE